MMKINLTMFSIILCVFSSQVHAQNDGIETGLSMGGAWTAGNSMVKGLNLTFTLDKMVTSKIGLGGEINWSGDLHRLFISSGTIVPKGDKTDAAFALMFHLKLRHPMFNKKPVQPYLKTGVGYLRMHSRGRLIVNRHNAPGFSATADNPDKIGMNIGIGLNFHNDQKVALFFESGLIIGFPETDKLRLINIKLGIRIK